MAAAAPTSRGHGLLGYGPTALALALFIWFLGFLPVVSAGQAASWAVPWIPVLGIDLAFRIDGLSLTFALLISGIGTLVLLYANSYLTGDPQFDRFVLFLTSFMLAMLGLVLADDLIVLFVFWELTTITSYLLIGYGHDSEESRRNALQALFLTGAGALAFLAGAILLGEAAGTYRISEILAQGKAIQDHPHFTAILILVFLGALTKSAQVPFHFWLPNAMAAPTPVSAFLHSATMVKAGVYLLARLHPAMSGGDLWLYTLTILGVVTAVFASLLALRQTDLKQALAYTTLMALGTLVMLLGQDSGYAMTAFATFLIVHSLYKAALFLVVGNLDAATGTRETDAHGGLGRVLPMTALAAALAGMSMAGLPPFLGFIGKELTYAGMLQVASFPVILSIMALLANGLILAVASVVAIRPFWSARQPKTPVKNAIPWTMAAGPVVLAVLGTIFGIMPGLLQNTLVAPTVLSLTGDIAETKQLKLWAGVNLPLFLSLATFVLGGLFYAWHATLRARLAMLDRLPNLDEAWDRFMASIKTFAIALTSRIQTGRMTDYMAVTFSTIAIGLVATVLLRGLPPLSPSFADVTPIHLALIGLLLSGTFMATITRKRIAAIAALGVVGIGVALVFIFFSAPDVAITQLLVEVLVVVLVAIVMLQLPRLRDYPNRFRPGHAVIAAGVGGSVTLVLLAILSTPLDRRLTTFFETASWPEAFGRNIVNVILVDFRALDTFGEVAVVVVAAIASIALLRQNRKGRS